MITDLCSKLETWRVSHSPHSNVPLIHRIAYLGHCPSCSLLQFSNHTTCWYCHLFHPFSYFFSLLIIQREPTNRWTVITIIMVGLSTMRLRCGLQGIEGLAMCTYIHMWSQAYKKASPNLWVSNIGALLNSTWSTGFSCKPTCSYIAGPWSAFTTSWTQWTSMDLKFMSFHLRQKKTHMLCGLRFSREHSAGKRFRPSSLNLARISLSWSIPSSGHKICTKG